MRVKLPLIRAGLLTAAAAFGFQILAVPAKPGVLTVRSADGTELRVKITGDEFFHQYLTEDGFPLYEKNGNFYYCDYDAQGNVVDSGIKAGPVESRSSSARAFLAKIDLGKLESRISLQAKRSQRRASMVNPARSNNYKAPALAADDNEGPPYERGYGLFPDLRFPAYGDQKAIVILVEYTDKKFDDSYDPKDYFTRMLNEEDFSDLGGTGSAAQFFRENSGGHFRPEFDVFGPVTLAHNMAYYGGNDWYGNDQRPADMVKEACELLDDTVDFSEYDRDGDGVVDNVFVFYAGKGEASGGGTNTVWPHSWNMEAAGYGNLMFDGVRVHTYGCSNEWEDGRPDGVGTFVHEFSHVMGLPDLYATSYTGAFTPGAWSALDYGPYNNGGMTPPNYGAFERYALGWLEPREIVRPLNATLQPVSDNVCGIIRTSKDNEFFLVENRQQEGWDEYIPGHGMLVWHVDYNSTIWSRNVVNNTESHQYVDIEEADGTQTETSRAGDAFPGSAKKTAFTPDTKPAMKTWSGSRVEYSITDIAEDNGLITFKVLGGAEDVLPDAIEAAAANVRPDSFTINWTPVEGYDALVNVYTRKGDAAESAPAKEESEKIFLKGYRNHNAGSASSLEVTGLEPETTYYFTVSLSSGWQTSEPSEEQSVETPRLTLDYYAPEATEASEIGQDSFVANWLPLIGASSYQISVSRLVPDGYGTETQSFDDGVGNLGDWSTSSGLTYGMASYSGENPPSLRLADGMTVDSPDYEEDIRNLKFWHRGNNTSSDDTIDVYAFIDGEAQLVAEVPVEKAVGGVVTEISELPEGTTKVRLQFMRKGDKGAVAIDDIAVGHGVNYARQLLENYNWVDAGNELSYLIQGLDPSTGYSYMVRATDGNLISLSSNEVLLKTLGGSGVKDIAGSAFTLSFNGLVVTSPTADPIIVSDYTGALVARGSHKVTLPRAGLYIVSVPSRGFVRKIIAR